MQFEWDERKNRANLAKHGIEFAAVVGIFDDPLTDYYPSDIVEGEQRWEAYGEIGGLTVVTVVHTYRGPAGDTVRIISARRATRHEARRYRG